MIAVDTGAVLPAGLLLRVSDDFGRTLRFDYSARRRSWFASGLRRVTRRDSSSMRSAASDRDLPGWEVPSIRLLLPKVSPSFLPLSDELLTGIIDENGVRTSTYR